MNKQQGPSNSRFTPNAQPTGKDGKPASTNETKTTVPQTRLRHKTKLYGMSQKDADSTTSSSSPNIQKNPTGQLGTDSTSANNTSIPRGNTGQLNPTNGFGHTGQFNPINKTGSTGQFTPINGSNNTGKFTPINGSGTTGQFNFINRSGNTGQLNPINGSGNTGQLNPTNRSDTTGTGQLNPINGFGNTGQLNPANGSANIGPFGAVTRQLGDPTGMLPNPNNTGTLMHPAGEYSGDTGMLKLNQAVKVVRIPVAGKPGEFKTGILPVLTQNTTGSMPPLSKASRQEIIKKNSKFILLGSLILLILFASGIYLLSRAGNTPQVAHNKTHPSSQSQINLNATAAANVQATATFTASLIVSDTLAYNARGWSTKAEKGIHRTFTGNTYHIRSDTSSYFAPSILWNEVPPTKYTYSLDMQEVAGDNTSQFNYYGLLLNYQQDKKNNPTFYLFCIVNEKNGSQYQFVRFDNKTDTKWSDSVWKKNTGKEFHSGKAKNTLMVQVDGSHFTFWANGVKLGTTQDKTFGSGSIGMGVNGVPGGAEVAFSNLILAQN